MQPFHLEEDEDDEVEELLHFDQLDQFDQLKLLHLDQLLQPVGNEDGSVLSHVPNVPCLHPSDHDNDDDKSYPDDCDHDDLQSTFHLP